MRYCGFYNEESDIPFTIVAYGVGAVVGFSAGFVTENLAVGLASYVLSAIAFQAAARYTANELVAARWRAEVGRKPYDEFVAVAVTDEDTDVTTGSTRKRTRYDISCGAYQIAKGIPPAELAATMRAIRRRYMEE